MKAWKKLSVCLLTLVLWVGVMAMPVFAEDASLDEVEVTLTTDKESYSQDEEIKATLPISNYNFIPAENISMENLIPEGYKLADGSEAVKTVESLEGEETAVLETVFVKDTTDTTPVVDNNSGETPSVVQAESSSPSTGYENSSVIWIGLTAAAGAAVLAVALKKRRISKKMLSLFLCLTLAGSLSAGISTEVRAEGTQRTIERTTTVAVDGQTLDINGVVKYDMASEPAAEDGTLIGKIGEASDGAAGVEGASIAIYSSDMLYAENTTDESGTFTQNLPGGAYRIEITAEGYLPFTIYTSVTDGETTYLETCLMIQGSEDETGTAEGTITNAIDGSGVNSASLTFRRGWNNTEYGEAVLTGTTAADGTYSAALPIGNYTMYVEKDGYISAGINIIVKQGTTGNQNGSITPILSGDSYRVVLTWGESPRDLDSYLTGKLSDGSAFTVYWNNQTVTENGEVVCSLDVDDRNSYGPETITLNTVSDEPYYYNIYKYSAGSLASSGAKINVYQGDTLVRTFNVPTDGSGSYWNVFAIKDGNIIVNNTISSSADTTYAN